MDHVCDECCRFNICSDKVDISSSEDEFNYIPSYWAKCPGPLHLDLDISNKEAIEELKQLEFFGRPFDNTPEESNKANRKMAAIIKAIEALQKLDQIDSIIKYGC